MITLNEKNSEMLLARLLQAEKDGYLFHGSMNKLTNLKVNKSNLSNKPVVFAGLLWAGVSFIPRWTDDDIGHMTVDGVPTIISRGKSYEEVFNVSGYLHMVPRGGFVQTKSIARYEFISYENVKVTEVFKIDNVLSVLKLLNVEFKTNDKLRIKSGF